MLKYLRVVDGRHPHTMMTEWSSATLDTAHPFYATRRIHHGSSHLVMIPSLVRRKPGVARPDLVRMRGRCSDDRGMHDHEHDPRHHVVTSRPSAWY